MNEAAMNSPHAGGVSERQVGFSKRLLGNLAVWLLAALAFQIFLRPAGLTETDLTPWNSDCGGRSTLPSW